MLRFSDKTVAGKPGARFSDLAKSEKVKAIYYGAAGALIALGYFTAVFVFQRIH